MSVRKGDPKNKDNVPLNYSKHVFPRLCGGDILIRRGEYSEECFTVASLHAVEIWPVEECRSSGHGPIHERDQKLVMEHLPPEQLQHNYLQEMLAGERIVDDMDGFQERNHVPMVPVMKQQKKAANSELVTGSGEVQKALATDVGQTAKEAVKKKSPRPGDRDYGDE